MKEPVGDGVEVESWWKRREVEEGVGCTRVDGTEEGSEKRAVGS